MSAKFILSVVLTVFASILNVSAQEYADGNYMASALTKTFEKAGYLEENTDYGFGEDFCLLGGFAETSESMDWKTRLEFGKEYVLIGGGDEDATDIDLEVYDPSGNLVVQDDESDNNPVVNFRAKSAGEYTFRLKLYECDANGSFCAMAIMEEGGYTIPQSRLETTLATMGQLWANAEESLDVRFHDKADQWSVFGSVIGPNESRTVRKLDMGDNDALLIGACDNFTNDIDLCINDGDGDPIECDSLEDNEPVVQHTTDNAYYYGLTIKNVDGNSSKSFIMTSVMTY